MFQSDDIDENFFNDILESETSTNIQNQKDFVFNHVISNPNNNNNGFQFCKPSTSRYDENIVKLFSKPKNNNNSGLFPNNKSPNRHRKVVQRKFPGPAGLLPKNKIDINLKNLEETDISINKTIAPDEIICSQISVNCFKESPWIEMCKDFYLENEKLCLPEKYSVFWVKTKAMSKQLLNQKTPFLAAIVKHIDYTTKNPMVILKDPTGEMSGTLHHEVWEEFSEKLNLGAVIVLQQVGVLITLKKCYLNITSNNIITIYHFKEPQALTQVSQNVITQRRNFQIIKIKNLSAREVQNSIEEYKKHFIEEKQNSLLFQEGNDNPFFKQNLSFSTALFTPGTSSAVINASTNMPQSSFRTSHNNPNQNLSSNPTPNQGFHVMEKNSQPNLIPRYPNQPNLIQKGPALLKRQDFQVNQNPIGSNLVQRGSEPPQSSVKKPKLAQIDQFSEEDIIAETPEFLQRTNLLIQNKNNQIASESNFFHESLSFSNNIVSKTSDFFNMQPNLNNHEAKYKLQDDMNICSENLGLDIISATPEVIGKVSRFDNSGVSSNFKTFDSAKNIVKNVFNNGSSCSNFKFVNKNNCDNEKIGHKKITNDKIESGKNIFSNDNFIDGLEESFLEDF